MKTIVLLSGGLDSSLALKMIQDQGIDVVALHFTSYFCRCDGSKGCGSAARKISDMVGTSLKIVHVGEKYLELIKNPRHGYGKNMNPCIDCRIFKFKYAKKLMEEEGASFIVTGEVVGQRPMSQHRRAMMLIEEQSGLKDLIVRPLSAQILEPTLPEREGWVDRDKFMDINGRSRKPQMELAEELGISDYPCPAGGCLLTDPNFCKRLKDLFENGTVDVNNVEMLKVGRQFRITPSFKLIIGRDERENGVLMSLAKEDDVILDPGELIAGATGVGRGVCDEAILQTSAKIMARYIDSETDSAEVHVQDHQGKEKEVISASKLEDNVIKGLMI